MSDYVDSSEVLEIEGLDFSDLMDSSVPACCSEGCYVEPDGKCSHGHPSVLLDMGLI